MKTIPLSQGKSALVDDDDHALLSEFKWCFRGERDRASGYAVRQVRVGARYRMRYLHRQLMNPPPGTEVIFLNHDTLDCRRANLRVATKQEARRHHRVRRDSRSGAKGVAYDARTGTWTAYVYRHVHAYHLGTFRSKEAATAAYEAAMRKENPALYVAPARVERPTIPEPVQSAREGSSPMGTG